MASAPRISQKSGKVIRPRGPNHRPTPHQLATWLKKEPERLFEDGDGRLYGEHDGHWFVRLPPTPPHAAVDECVEFPEEGSTLTLQNLKTKERREVRVESYPEKIERNHRTAVLKFE